MGMKHTEDVIALQAIEFWSTVADQEIELNWEFVDVRVLVAQNLHRTRIDRNAGPGKRRTPRNGVAALLPNCTERHAPGSPESVAEAGRGCGRG